MNFDFDWRKLGIDVSHIKREGKTTCPKCGPTRKNKRDKSLSVNVETGDYNCHNSPCDFRGNAGSGFVANRPQKVYQKPLPRLQLVSDKALAWFESRGISNNTLLMAKVTWTPDEWMPQDEQKHSCICFNYYRGDELVNIKFRTGAKDFKMAKDCELIFYNLNAIREESKFKFVVIVEGEIDCLTFIECGMFRVISVPNGANQLRPGQAPRLEYLDNCWQELSDVETIILALDNDQAGKILEQELIRRLGVHKCWMVTYPEGCKDANEVLVQHGKQGVLNLLQREHLRQAPLEGVLTMDDFEADADYIYDHGYPVAYELGWDLDNHMKWLPGDATVVTGIPNHGKSTVVSNIIVELSVKHGWVWGVFSPEKNRSAFMVAELATIFIGSPVYRANPYDKMSREEWQRAKQFVREHFVFIKTTGIDTTLDGLLGIGDALVVRYGINGLLLDPWNYVETDIPYGQTETVWLGNQLGKLTEWSKRNLVHTIVVAHPTKMQKDKKSHKFLIPTLYDISGSAHWNNKIDNGICVYRNYDEGTTTIYVHKVRWFFVGRGGGSVKMAFEPNSQRFVKYVQPNSEQMTYEEIKSNRLMQQRGYERISSQPAIEFPAADAPF